MADVTIENLVPGKRYKGSGMINAAGDFSFRRYKESSKKAGDEENPDPRLLDESDFCQIWNFKEKVQIKIDIPLKKLNAPTLFTIISNQMTFLNKVLFTKKPKK